MVSIEAHNQASLLRVAILALISIVAFGSRLFSVIRYESVIHEFDPWFNYRVTMNLVRDGFYEFWNWFDSTSWYPLGRAVGPTLYPGLMTTSAVIYNILHFFNLPVDIRNVCVFLAPVFSAFTAIATYKLTKEAEGPTAGLFAAAFIAVAPGYISRSVSGSYDNEAIAIFIMVFTFFLWLRAIRLGSALYGALTALSYFYMVASWGGYVFLINIIPLHVFALLLMGRYSNRLYVSYSTFYVLGTLLSMQIPFVGFVPTDTSEHMAALGTFGLVQLFGFAAFVKARVPEKEFQLLLKGAVAGLVCLGAVMFAFLSAKGIIAPWTGRLYSLWDTGYAKKHIPIIASVSEHQPTPWSSFFFDLNFLIWLFPVGVYFCFRKLEEPHVFMIIYSLFAVYFAGVMIRLMLTLTPVVCFTAGIAMSRIFEEYLDMRSENPDSRPEEDGTTSGAKDEDRSPRSQPNTSGILKKIPKLPRIGVIFNFLFFLILYQLHCTWVTSGSYSSPSVVLSSQTADGNTFIIDDFREAYYWLRKNTPEDAKVLSWWDYGYQLAGMANRTTLVDNNTWNNTHIATVGRVFASDEDSAYEILKKHDVDYVVVVFGGFIGYSGDDINKFLWMIRIAEGIYPEHVKESDFFNSNGQYAIGDQASQTMKRSVMHKLSYYRFNELFGGRGTDRVRNQPLPSYPIVLNNFEEAYTSAHWMVRIYKVKELDNLGRTFKQSAHFSHINAS
ncbi:oligosaccharyl transferase stt3 subunit [Mycoemilia scoparia]|uniref:dolichyl-diphosphooligosaccharide--protein glycotransferase n=1 Tax=Mycoemilia scoparia TaxID=417184 RepID=A0A9W8A5L3_9FUNG|nr:oligosaccharyl transferase stt3 subunit [Mycoemilia scoparia]